MASSNRSNSTKAAEMFGTSETSMTEPYTAIAEKMSPSLTPSPTPPTYSVGHGSGSVSLLSAGAAGVDVDHDTYDVLGPFGPRTATAPAATAPAASSELAKSTNP